MRLFMLFPACNDLFERSIAADLDQRFERECAQNGIAFNAQAAERIGVSLLADVIIGLPLAKIGVLSWYLMLDGPGIDIDTVPLKEDAG